MASINDQIERGRKPRVHIKYEVEVGDAKLEKELPFVVGVIGDFSGSSLTLPPLEKRRFVQIHKDNFDEVMEKAAPELHFRVANTMAGDGSELEIDLQFREMADFNPDRVAAAVPELKKMMTDRNLLRDLVTKVNRSAELERLLDEVLKSDEKLRRLRGDLGGPGSEGDPS